MKPERIDEARLHFSETILYGRDEEIVSLRESYEQVQASKQPEIILLKGYAGTGKSVLANTLQDVTSSNGFYISGKFEEMGSSRPYSAIVDAFANLCKMISTSKQADVIKLDLQNAIGMGDILILGRILPEIFSLFPTDLSKSVHDMKTEWGFERLKRAFRHLVKVVSNNDITLVLFIDDLQWADTGSLEVLRDIITDEEKRSFLFVGAYRSNEIDRAHPLSLQLRGIESLDIPTKEITVTNLDVDSVNALIAEATRSSPLRTLPLAEVVQQKTGGNAFFTVQFLRMLRAESMLYMSSKTYMWEWNMDKIVGDTDISDNVVGLVARKIKRLPVAAVKALQVGSCLGSRFHFKV